jgi:hypothetical protein
MSPGPSNALPVRLRDEGSGPSEAQNPTGPLDAEKRKSNFLTEASPQLSQSAFWLLRRR